MSDKILKLSQAQTLYEDLRERIDALPTNEDIPSVPVQDVQVNGTSILSQGVANVPIAGASTPGVVIVRNSTDGLLVDSNNRLSVSGASDAIVKAGESAGRPVTPAKQHASVFYGLAKAAGADMKDIANTTVGTYPDAQKAAIQNMLGITGLLSTEESSTATATHALNSTFMMGGKLYRATAAIAIGDAVEVGTNCEVVKADEVFVKNTDYASANNFGITSAGAGLRISNSTNKMIIDYAGSNKIKLGTEAYNPIVPYVQHEAVYFGLSKVAGVDLANETVTVGTYPESSKTAIRSLIGAGTPLDVQINETSIVSNGVANIPIANESTAGVIKVESQSTSGLTVDNTTKGIRIVAASSNSIKASSSSRMPITPYYQHEATFYGLSKAAGVDMSSSSNAVGQYTDSAKTAIRNMLGATSSNVIAVQDEQPTDTDTKVWLPETESTGIEVPTYAEFQALDAAVVKKTDYAYQDVAGIVRVNKDGAMGLKITTENSTGEMRIAKADSTNIKNGTVQYKPIVPYNQHEAVFFGLSKAAGVDLASETVTVGTYPATASAAIRSMLGAVGDVQVNGTSIVSNGIANIPYGGHNIYGLVRTGGYGIQVLSNGYLAINGAGITQIKAGTDTNYPIASAHTHEIAFYGLAKAAGDTTQSQSENAVGTYTSEAKAAIHTMLGIDPASIAAQVDIPLVETVSGTTPTITGQPNVRYVCDEVSTITITPPASGSVDVIFESGSTATTMTVPSTVKWPAWFDAEALEANTTYEVLITDGIYGSVMTWAT